MTLAKVSIKTTLIGLDVFMNAIVVGKARETPK